MDPNSSPRQGDSQPVSTRYLIGSTDATQKLGDPCPNAQTLIAWSHVVKRVVLCILQCNRWGCRNCGPRKAKRLAYRIERAEPNKLITLTVNPRCYATPREAYDKTRRQLAELSKVVKKQIGSFEYLRVLETTKSGWPHYHLMARCPYIPQKTLSTIWANLTNAPIVDIRQIKRIDNVFAYVVKYLCKQTYIPWTNRRTSWSRHFFQNEPPFEPEDLWLDNFKIVKEHPEKVASEKYKNFVIEQITKTAFFIRPPDDEEDLNRVRQNWKQTHGNQTANDDPQGPTPGP